MTDIFKADQQTENPASPEDQQEGSYLEQLVGEGKKFSDPEALARGKYEADSFIQKLQAELEEARGEIKTRLNMQEFLDQMKQQGGQSPNDTQPRYLDGAEPQGRTDQAVALTPEQVQELVAAKINESQEQSSRERNSQESIQRMAKHNIRPEDLNGVCQDLGVEPSFLQELAETNPNAFERMISGSQSQRPNPASSISSITAPPTSMTPTRHMTQEKNFDYYKKMQREDPKRYYSKQVQVEIHNAAMAAAKAGKDFYNRS